MAKPVNGTFKRKQRNDKGRHKSMPFISKNNKVKPKHKTAKEKKKELKMIRQKEIDELEERIEKEAPPKSVCVFWSFNP